MSATIIPFPPRAPATDSPDKSTSQIMGCFVAWCEAREEIRRVPFTRTNIDRVCARYGLSEISIENLVREEHQYRTLVDC